MEHIIHEAGAAAVRPEDYQAFGGFIDLRKPG